MYISKCISNHWLLGSGVDVPMSHILNLLDLVEFLYFGISLTEIAF